MSALCFSAPADLPTGRGNFRCQAVRGVDDAEQLVVYKGAIQGRAGLPVRIHSECLTSEVLGSLRCDCHQQLAAALEHFESEALGLLIYLRQEGRGIGLYNKIEAYALQDTGLDTVEANAHLGLPEDARSYRVAVDVLRHFEISSVRLLTNNPHKIKALEDHGIEVIDRIPIIMPANSISSPYLETKKGKMRHLL